MFTSYVYNIQMHILCHFKIWLWQCTTILRWLDDVWGGEGSTNYTCCVVLLNHLTVPV